MDLNNLLNDIIVISLPAFIIAVVLYSIKLYIKSLKATFYILKINNYIHNTQCELIMLRL